MPSAIRATVIAIAMGIREETVGSSRGGFENEARSSCSASRLVIVSSDSVGRCVSCWPGS